VPKNRRHIDRDERVTQILDAAERRLRDGGDAALSVADIARELGIAANAVYWYFPSRDHLLVAVVERVVARTLAAKPRHRSPVEEVVWLVGRLAAFEPLRSAVHERARTSSVVADFQAGFAGGLDAMVGERMREAGWEGERGAVALDAVRAVVEGVLVADMTPAHRERVVRYALTRLLEQA
jgi:AcrR family transcriptional regulator